MNKKKKTTLGGTPCNTELVCASNTKKKKRYLADFGALGVICLVTSQNLIGRVLEPATVVAHREHHLRKNKQN